jgi:voltage-gated potassium channel
VPDPALRPRVLAPNLFIVARAETEDAERKLLRAGASRVLSPYHIGAVQMAQTAVRPAVQRGGGLMEFNGASYVPS